MAERKTTKKKAPQREKQGSQYEAMFLFPASVASDVDHALATARQMIERHDGKIILIKKWDERKLAYEMKKNKRGVYIIAYFTGPGAAVGAIEREVNLSEEVLRVMVTKADHLNETEMNAVEPQPVQPRTPPPDDRGGWDRPPREDRGDRAPREDRGSREDRPPRRREEAEEPAPQA